MMSEFGCRAVRNMPICSLYFNIEMGVEGGPRDSTFLSGGLEVLRSLGGQVIRWTGGWLDRCTAGGK